ncbi:unnamed protein product [Vitrella brassicaformis CCMP3155]|uniref:Uncharacterized protein n=2 Tax=Vitrella brassicaformis TaxID=1169539 RepID=A0A0G4FRU2_VITBC|nr:unnamed protein product [Vitrella brassicaformis CCMP3155]|eukprot:CEM17381.1 unnamed protein product [Vitrella brassicaformis CCMP3155]
MSRGLSTCTSSAASVSDTQPKNVFWVSPQKAGFGVFCQTLDFLFEVLALWEMGRRGYHTIMAIDLVFIGVSVSMHLFWRDSKHPLMKHRQRGPAEKVLVYFGMSAMGISIDHCTGKIPVWTPEIAKVHGVFRSIDMMYRSIPALLSYVFFLFAHPANYRDILFWDRFGFWLFAVYSAVHFAYTTSSHIQHFAQFPHWKGFFIVFVFHLADIGFWIMQLGCLCFFLGCLPAVLVLLWQWASRQTIIITRYVLDKKKASPKGLFKYLRTWWYLLFVQQPINLIASSLGPVGQAHPVYRWIILALRYIETAAILTFIWATKPSKSRMDEWGVGEDFHIKLTNQVLMPWSLVNLYFHTYCVAAIASGSMPSLIHLNFNATAAKDSNVNKVIMISKQLLRPSVVDPKNRPRSKRPPPLNQNPPRADAYSKKIEALHKPQDGAERETPEDDGYSAEGEMDHEGSPHFNNDSQPPFHEGDAAFMIDDDMVLHDTIEFPSGLAAGTDDGAEGAGEGEGGGVAGKLKTFHAFSGVGNAGGQQRDWAQKP